MEKIDLRYYGNKHLNGNFKLSLNFDWHLFLLLIDFVKHLHVSIFLINYIARLIKKLIVVSHQLILTIDLLQELLCLRLQLMVRLGQNQLVFILLAQIISFVYFMVLVKFFSRNFHLLTFLMFMQKTRNGFKRGDWAVLLRLFIFFQLQLDGNFATLARHKMVSLLRNDNLLFLGNIFAGE